jgi:CheY-like chemotaxis protein
MSHQNATILLVEDDEDTRQMYAVSLECYGFQIRHARDGLEGVSLAAMVQPDVIVMDLAMPRMDGLEATRRLKNDPATASIPVVVLTALTSPGDCTRALQAGADDFLTKPLDPDALAYRLRDRLARRAR